jgi:hypothetical protein
LEEALDRGNIGETNIRKNVRIANTDNSKVLRFSIFMADMVKDGAAS